MWTDTARQNQGPDVNAIADRVRAEYLEMPGLCLTKAQVQRRWSISAATSQTVLSRLVQSGFLRRTPGGYALSS